MFWLDSTDPTPLYAQLERAIRSAIATEQLRVGDRLPTVRQLAVELRINANTVAKVYGELERAGVLETRRGVGTFVRNGQKGPAPGPERERAIASFTSRILAEMGALGMSLHDLIKHLTHMQSLGRHSDGSSDHCGNQ